ncbi:MAG: potassium channel protein [Vicinamibacterales bacterium]
MQSAIISPTMASGNNGHWTWRRGPGLAIILFLLVTTGGTLGYMVIEGWSAWDALYMTIISVTTAGYKEVHEMSWAGQAWTMFVLVGGVSTLFYTAFVVMAEVVEGGFQHRFESRRFNRMLEQLTNHFIICGYGRIGGVIADEFRRQGIPYVVIDRDPERVHEVIERGGMAVEADASREDVLKKVGIDRARGLIAAVGTDAENVYTVLTARVLQPELFIIARIESEDAEPKLRRAGADRVLSPYHLGGVQMAATALRPAVVDFMRLATSSESLDLAAEQVEIGSNNRFVGQNIRDANLRQDFGVIVVAIKRKAGHMEFNPEPESIIGAGDQLVVLGHPDQLKALEAAATG